MFLVGHVITNCLNIFAVIKPNSVSFVDAAGCVGECVRSYLALYYLGRLVSGDTGKCYFLFKNYTFNYAYAILPLLLVKFIP